jgi:hypothetical protein
LEFSSGKSYIGITESTPELRFRDHKGSAIKRGSKCLVHKAWRKHGGPQLIVLAVVENKDLRVAEQKAIQAFGTMTPGGYNMTPGGEIAPSSIIHRIRSSISKATVWAKKQGREFCEITIRSSK